MSNAEVSPHLTDAMHVPGFATAAKMLLPIISVVFCRRKLRDERHTKRRYGLGTVCVSVIKVEERSL
jgi:hypothetical protein